MTETNPYETAFAVLLAESGCIVRKWRSGRTGCADTSSDAWEIEVPRPTGPVSFGVAAHEVGHQLLHRTGSLPRWLEEVEAEEFALAQFDRFGLPGRDRYARNVVGHLGYAFAKALRRSRTDDARRQLTARIIKRAPGWWAAAERADALAMFAPSMSRERAALDRAALG